LVEEALSPIVQYVEPSERAEPDEWVVRTHALTKVYGDRVAVSALEVNIPADSVTAFVGPNGSGKSTTIRMLLGLVRPTSGSGEVLGKDIRRPASYVPRVGALVESPAFYPQLSARRNLEVLAVLGGINASRIAEVIEMVGLVSRQDDRYSTFSLGMKQRLGIAAALLPNPRLLILDEPGNGLDPSGIAALRLLLRRLCEAGTSVLVSSHHLSELQQVADWVIMIRKGKLLYQGTLDDLLKRDHQVVIGPENPADLPELQRILQDAGYPCAEHEDGLTVSGGADHTGILNRLAAEQGIVLSEIRVVHQSLEEVYFGMTENNAESDS
jgi:ABC-2 type transport system ATP-binding protein